MRTIWYTSIEMTLTTLKAAWDRLRSEQALKFRAKSSSEASGWNASGSGTVIVGMLGSSSITFTESGKWRSDSGQELEFNNVYRWTLVKASGTIRLEHLRQGPNQPIHLFDLAPTDANTFQSVAPHRCGADLYTAIMEFKNEAIYLRWNVKGPKKDEHICCIYAHSASMNLTCLQPPPFPNS